MCIGGYNHVILIRNMRAVVFGFAELSWRRGLCAKKPRGGLANEKKVTGGRPRRERGAGGRARCMECPWFELCGRAALKSARATSRQTVPRRALRKESRSDIFSCFLVVNEFEIRNELTSHVGREADELVGPVVELVEQNAIELHLWNGCRRNGCKETFRAFGRTGKTRRSECRVSELSF